MKTIVEFLKKQPLITGLIGMLFVSLSIRYLGPRMVGNLEAGAVASNTQDYVNISGDLAMANLGFQLIVIAFDIAILIWL